MGMGFRPAGGLVGPHGEMEDVGNSYGGRKMVEVCALSRLAALYRWGVDALW